MTRRRRHRPISRLRFAAAHRFRMLLDSLQSVLKHAGGLTKLTFPVLEKLSGIVGENTMLEAVCWHEAGLVRLVHAEPDRRTHGKLSLSKRRMTKIAPTNDDCNSSLPTCSTSSTPDVASSHLSDLSTKSPFFFEVMPRRATYNSYYLLPNVNYCTCKYFQKQVLKRKNRITCSHFLAVWLSQCLDSYTHIVMRQETVDMIARNIISRSQEFY